MWTWIKNILLFLAVSFFLFFIIFEPNKAGEFFENVFEGIAFVFKQVTTMFKTIANG